MPQKLSYFYWVTAVNFCEIDYNIMLTISGLSDQLYYRSNTTAEYIFRLHDTDISTAFAENIASDGHVGYVRVITRYKSRNTGTSANDVDIRLLSGFIRFCSR
jgi:hypothetical protein